MSVMIRWGGTTSVETIFVIASATGMKNIATRKIDIVVECRECRRREL